MMEGRKENKGKRQVPVVPRLVHCLTHSRSVSKYVFEKKEMKSIDMTKVNPSLLQNSFHYSTDCKNP
jgi:hypothetical protein